MSEPAQPTVHRRATRPSPAPSAADLRHLVAALVTTPPDGGPAPGAHVGHGAVGVRLSRHGKVDVLFQAFDDDAGPWHPAELLVGYRAPASWKAFGILSSGRAHLLDEAGGGGPPPPSGPLAHLVSTTGESCTALAAASPGDGPGDVAVFEASEPVAGLMADACRRVLGLPTAPVEVGPTAWLTGCWLDRVVACASASGAVTGRLGWADVVALHPCAGAVPAATDPAELLDLVDDLMSELASGGWEALHAAVASGRAATHPAGDLAAAVCPADHAAWLDPPSFARYLLAGLPDTRALVEAAGALVSPRLAAGLRRAVASW